MKFMIRLMLDDLLCSVGALNFPAPASGITHQRVPHARELFLFRLRREVLLGNLFQPLNSSTADVILHATLLGRRAVPVLGPRGTANRVASVQFDHWAASDLREANAFFH